MKTVFMRGGIALSLLAALVLFAGCSGEKDKKAKDDDKTHKDHKDDDHKDDDHKHTGKDKNKDKEEDEHTSADGFWCISHGVPELECSMCQAKVEKEARAKGDWCEMHNRAKSQCFICDPKLKSKYDKQYKARYGKEPPLTDDEKAAKKEKEKK